MNSIVHFEIPINSPEEAKKFYSDTFGWNIQQWGDKDYWMASTTEVDEQTRMPKKPGMINGGMMKREGDFQHPILTISVDDIEATLAKIEAAGGKTIKGKDAVGDMGWTAYFEDTQGNMMGLWQNNAQSDNK